LVLFSVAMILLLIRQSIVKSMQVADKGYFLLGTLAPLRLAFDSPMAIACFLLFTFLPLPLRSVPFLRLCMLSLTESCAFFP
jgi:hypothetical protein